MARRIRFFTLPEVVAVILIIGLMAAVAVPMLRKASPSYQIEQSAAEFERFCSRVRYQAAENGGDRSVFFKAASRTFFMKNPDSEENGVPEDAMFKWVLPEDFETDESVFPDPSGEDVEIVRFFPDGGASGVRNITLRCGSFSKVISVSPLTGFLSVRDVLEGESR